LNIALGEHILIRGIILSKISNITASNMRRYGCKFFFSAAFATHFIFFFVFKPLLKADVEGHGNSVRALTTRKEIDYSFSQVLIIRVMEKL